MPDTFTPNLNLDKPALSAFDIWGAKFNLNMDLIDAASITLRGTPVVATAPLSGQVLTFNGTAWAPATPAPAGVSGSGTTGKLPKWLSGTSLGNSILSDDGTTLAVTGNVNITGSYEVGGVQIALANLSDGNSVLLANGSRALTGDQSAGGHKLTNLATPTASADAATKGYVDGITPPPPADASTAVKGITKLSVAPLLASSPIAVGDNDPRMSDARSLLGALAGDVTGAQGATVVAKINGVALGSAPTSGQILTATGAASAAWQTLSFLGKSADTVLVAPSGGDYTTVGAAVAALGAPGIPKVILVAPATYTESPFTLPGNISIIGLGRPVQLNFSSATAGITITGTPTVLEFINITNSSGPGVDVNCPNIAGPNFKFVGITGTVGLRYLADNGAANGAAINLCNITGTTGSAYLATTGASVAFSSTNLNGSTGADAMVFAGSSGSGKSSRLSNVVISAGTGTSAISATVATVIVSGLISYTGSTPGNIGANITFQNSQAISGVRFPANPAANQFLIATSATAAGWQSPTVGGDLTGAILTPTVTKIRGTLINPATPLGGQVLQFDGTQWTPTSIATGNIGGAGVAGQVTFFTSGTTISSDSGLVWDNTNKRLGIGASSPLSSLDVAGDFSLSATVPSEVAYHTGLQRIGPDTIFWYGGGVGDLVLKSGAVAGPGDRIMIKQNGRVGLGKVNPGYLLDAAGDINVSGVFRVGGVALASTNLSDGGTLVYTSDSRLSDARPLLGALAGDVTGAQGATVVAKINGISLSGTPSAGQVLTATSASAANWQAVPSAAPGGASGQVQFNNAGSFGGASNFWSNGGSGVQLGLSNFSGVPANAYSIVVTSQGEHWFAPGQIQLSRASISGSRLNISVLGSTVSSDTNVDQVYSIASAEKFRVNSTGVSVTGDANVTGLYRVGGVQIASTNLSDSANLFRADGSIALTGNANAGGFQITNLPAPVNPGDAARKSYVDGVAQGLSIKGSVRALANSNVALTGTQTIDGVALLAGDRVLLTGQTNPVNNGIYVVAAGAWARSADMANGSSAFGAFTFVGEGTNYIDSGWVCNDPASAAIVGTASLGFTQFSGAGQIIAGNGLSKSGNTLSLIAPVSIVNGGTGATSAPSALSNLGGVGGSGVAGRFALWTSGSAIGSDTNIAWDSANRALLIGGFPSAVPLSFPRIEIISSAGDPAAHLSVVYGSGGGDPVFLGLRAGGTQASPAATPSGKTLAQLDGMGHDGTAFDLSNKGGSIKIEATETWSPTAHGAAIKFQATAAGTLTLNTAIYATGNGGGRVGFGGNTTPGFAVDATGDINASGLFRVGGTQIASANLSDGGTLIKTSTAIGGDLSGTLPNPTVAKLGTTGTSVTVNTAAPPTTGQVLTATSATAAAWQTPSGGGGYATVVVAAPTGVAATDTANIQNAINSISAGTVILREGLYLVNATLTLKSRITIKGQGKGEFGAGAPTTIKCDNAMGDIPLIDVNNISNLLDVSLEDFSIDFNGFTRASRSGSYDIRMMATRAAFRRIAVANTSGAGPAILLQPADTTQQDSAMAIDCVFVQGKRTAAGIGNWTVPFALSGKVSGCTFIGNTATGGFQNALATFLAATEVTGCVFRTSIDYSGGVLGSTVGIDASQSNGRGGISLTGCCFIQESGTATRAIQVAAGTSNVTVSGNFAATGSVGSISVFGTGSPIAIVGNTGFSSYSNGSTGTSVANDNQTFNGIAVSTTAPATGQVLTATSATAASWQTPSGYAATVVVASPTGVAATDTSAISTALTAASTAGGGTVLLREGTYAINATLTVPAKVILKGQGRSATVLQASGLGSVPILAFPNTESGMDSLTVDLNFGARGTLTTNDITVSGTFVVFSLIRFINITSVGNGSVFFINETVPQGTGTMIMRSCEINGGGAMLGSYGMAHHNVVYSECQFNFNSTNAPNRVIVSGTNSGSITVVGCQVFYSSSATSLNFIEDLLTGVTLVVANNYFFMNGSGSVSAFVFVGQGGTRAAITGNVCLTTGSGTMGGITGLSKTSITGNVGFVTYSGGTQSGNIA